jgi:signal peptidase I
MSRLLGSLGTVLLQSPDRQTAQAADSAVREAAERWLPRSRHRRLAEGIEVLLIICLLVVTLRTFFVLPSQIPTGSMQPTLYGVTLENRRADPDFQRPGWLRRGVERFCFGRIHYQVVARAAGRLEEILPPEPRFSWLGLPQLALQRFRVGQEWYTIPAPPVMPASPFDQIPDYQAFLLLGGVHPRRTYQPGEPILQAVYQAGDRLLVDRFTYQWRRPRRGEIVVFQPHDIEELDSDTYYLKRLVGLPGERFRIGDDRHVWINGERIGNDQPGFRRLYDFSGPPEEDVYSGHANQSVASRYRRSARGLAPHFRNGLVERLIPEGETVLLGDNTLESLDSRRFGPVPMAQVVGRAWSVYWPWSERIGFGFE